MSDVLVIYVSGKYKDVSREAENENILKARRVAIPLWEAGFSVICPHLNTAHFHDDCQCKWEDYLRGDLELVRRSDAMIMVDNWTDSRGAKEERRLAMRYRKPIFYKIEEAIAWKEKNSKNG